VQRLIEPRRRRNRFMAHPRRRRRRGLHQVTLTSIAVLAIAGGGSVTASMLGAQPSPDGAAGPTTPTVGKAASVSPEVDPTAAPAAAVDPPSSGGHAGPAAAPALPERVEPSASLPIDHEDPRVEPTPVEPPERRPVPPLPGCETGDMRAPGIDDDEWQTTLLDRMYGLPRRYRPSDLVSVRQAGFDASWRVRAVVIEDLALMRRAARRAGAPLTVVSGYRSYQNQATVFDMWRGHLGRDAISASARPGHSEHQLGTSLDFRSADSYRDPWAYRDWGRTPEGRWLADHSWRYGFVLSYPRGAEPKTCYGYEPWHFRYVGRALATAVHESGLTLREYLWEKHALEP
jgi:D-alanyl-D-alanine carboxypeptidase